jgi:hypothetical protein
MTSFSLIVRGICVGVLSLLVFYTLFLLRSGRLNAHISVRWLLAECTAIFMVLLWGVLPLISYTSALNDREMLVILAVIFFGLISFLILDSLVRISTHTRQIKVLTQELALLRGNIDTSGIVKLSHMPIEKSHSVNQNINEKQNNHHVKGFKQVLLALWIVCCLGIYLLQMYPSYPVFLQKFFTAKYQE